MLEVQKSLVSGQRCLGAWNSPGLGRSPIGLLSRRGRYDDEGEARSVEGDGGRCAECSEDGEWLFDCFGTLEGDLPLFLGTDGNSWIRIRSNEEPKCGECHSHSEYGGFESIAQSKDRAEDGRPWSLFDPAPAWQVRTAGSQRKVQE